MQIKKDTLVMLGILLVLVVGGFFFLRKGNSDVSGNVQGAQVVQGQTQKAIIGVKNGNYYPNEIRVKAGEPVSISLDSSVTGCFRSLNIKDLGVSKYAKTPEETIDFTPTKKGTFKFACSMGMGYGNIIVE